LSEAMRQIAPPGTYEERGEVETPSSGGIM
jgi:hypothetical protein